MAGTGDHRGSGKLTVDAVGVDALNVPKCFWIPGTASIFNGYFGAGGIAGFGQGALVAGPGPFPFTSQMYGVNNVVGSHITNGVRITNGVDLMTGGVATVASAIWKCLSATASISSKTIQMAAGKNVEIAAGKNLDLGAAKELTLFGNNTNIYSTTETFIDGRAWSVASASWDLKKDFDISHPTKSGWRLRHVCIEGPTADVFVKGMLNGSNMIELPDYWTGLVDYGTITVNITPISVHQELFVDKIENNKVYIKNNSGGMIKCHYLICGERKDVEKNIPEYEGTYDDYPGDNSQYSGSLFNNLLRKS